MRSLTVQVRILSRVPFLLFWASSRARGRRPVRCKRIAYGMWFDSSLSHHFLEALADSRRRHPIANWASDASRLGGLSPPASAISWMCKPTGDGTELEPRRTADAVLGVQLSPHPPFHGRATRLATGPTWKVDEPRPCAFNSRLFRHIHLDGQPDWRRDLFRKQAIDES